VTRILFFDTETTGLPVWNAPSDSDVQPHLVQLGALLVDYETREVVEEMDVIVSPDFWTIPEEVSKIHGITHDHALEVGNDEYLVLAAFHLMCQGANIRVAHNRTFDQRIIRIAMKRYFGGEIGDQALEKWAEKDDFHDTMLMAKNVMKLEPKGRYGYKNPTLAEAYKFFTGKELEGGHNAMIDTRACMEIYFAMIDQNVFKINFEGRSAS